MKYARALIALLVVAGAWAEGPRPQRGYPDRPLLRSKALEEWFGGMPTPEQLDQRRLLAERELTKWERAIPGTRAFAERTGRYAPAASILWRNVGPLSGTGQHAEDANQVDTGRPTVVLPHPTRANWLYVGFAGGGVWRCKNADPASTSDWVWEPLTDALPAGGSGNLSVGGLAVDPDHPDTLFMALGDMEPGSADSTASGRGFYMSQNGGDTWSFLGTVGNTTRVRSVMALPGGVVLVAGNDGLHRSENGGQTFTKVSLSNVSLAWTLVQLADGKLALSTQATSTYRGQIWTSADAGKNWTLATFDSTLTGKTPYRMSLAAASTGNTLYATFESYTNANYEIAQGVAKSVDGGANWTFVSGPSLFAGVSDDGLQGSYNQMLAVDPLDSNRLFLGTNLSLWRSQDGGATWSQMTDWMGEGKIYTHADFHVSAWSPTGTPRNLYMGTDGGLAILRDPARVTIPSGSSSLPLPSDPTFIDHRRNKGVATHMIYHLGSTNAQTPANARDRIIIGLQDMGTRIRKGTDLANSGRFDVCIGGDGFGTLIHPLNGDLMLGSLYNTRIRRTANGGGTWVNVTGITEANTDGAPFLTRITQGLGDPTGNTVYTFVNKKVYRSTDFGSTWSALATNGFDANIRIRAVGTAASDPQTLGVASGYSGTDQVVITKDGGLTWTSKALPTNHPGSFGWIAFDPQNAETVYLSSVSFNTSRSHLWKSTNGGDSWTAIDSAASGFPYGVPVHCVVPDPVTSGTVYAGTDWGIYRTADGGTSWARFGDGLPLVSVRDIFIAPDASFMRIGTHGRGVWEIPYSTAVAAPKILVQPRSATAYEGRSVAFGVTASGSFPMTYQWTRNGVDLLGQMNPYLVVTPTMGDNNATFAVRVTNGVSSATSQNATLTVLPGLAPQILSQPQSLTVTAGDPASFSITATSTLQITYQWLKDGAALQGATSDVLELPVVLPSDAGTYQVALSTSSGGATSNPAVLTVNANPNILFNPGYEADSSMPWRFSDGGMVATAADYGFTAHEGTNVAWLGNWDKPNVTDHMYQDVALPVGTGAAPFSFYLAIVNNDNTPAAATNILKAEVRDTAGAVLKSLATFDNTQAAPGVTYTKRGPWDLKEFAGRTVRVYLTSSQPGGSGTGTNFLIDTMSLLPTKSTGALAKDVDGNGVVDIFDLGLLCRGVNGVLGASSFSFLGDLNGDGKITQADLDLFLAGF